MEPRLQTHTAPDGTYHFIRPRLNQLFSQAVKSPLVTVCAGAGYGKTSAVHDFIQECQTTASWIQLSKLDNIGTRFWENYTHSLAHINKPFAQAVQKTGFPDTESKINQYFEFLRDFLTTERHFIVMDDFHLIDNPSVIRLFELGILDMPPGTTLFLLSRTVPQINFAGLVSKGQMSGISENDLKFSESEVFEYFQLQGISLPVNTLREILNDTGGWAFAINLIARSYLNAPGYTGYVRNAMKTNVFRLMETEIWNNISGKLQMFLLRISLIEHLSAELISLLANNDNELLAGLQQLNAYIRHDAFIDAWLIHHLFLEFLRARHNLLSGDLKLETWKIAGAWCSRNGFKIDALAYYEKTGDYPAIVSIFFELPAQIPVDIARYALEILERTPEAVFDKIVHLALMHVSMLVCLGQWKDAFDLMRHYEAKFQPLPKDSEFRNRSLGGLYNCWGILRMLMCTMDDRYDFDEYYARQDECLTRWPVDPRYLADHPLGPWISLVGTDRKGAPEEFVEALVRAEKHTAHCLNGVMTGAGDLARGELLFYQGDISGAESFVIRALQRARERRQFEIVHRALFHIMRIAVFQGDFAKTQRTLKDMETQLDKDEYPNCYITFDIVLAWYYCILHLPEKIPAWLKEKFEPYSHPYFIENFGNQARAMYCFLTGNYPPLLAYIGELKLRESILFGRLEMLVLEACVHYKLKNKALAFDSLRQAWESSLPNGIVSPFIEMGKDMRTLSAAALQEHKCPVNKSWLKNINLLSASYAKRQVHIIAEYKQANNMNAGTPLSSRESGILNDLSHGLSRIEIAASRGLSINTVKMVINNVYGKLGAQNLADLIRIASENKMI